MGTAQGKVSRKKKNKNSETFFPTLSISRHSSLSEHLELAGLDFTISDNLVHINGYSGIGKDQNPNGDGRMLIIY